MATQMDKYKASRTTELNETFWNLVVGDIDRRAAELEGKLENIDTSTDALVVRGLELLNTSVAAQIAALQQQISDAIALMNQAAEGAGAEVQALLNSANDQVVEITNAANVIALQVNDLEDLIESILAGSLPASSISLLEVVGMTAANVQEAIAELFAAIDATVSLSTLTAAVSTLEDAIAGKASSSHSHAISDVTDLAAALAGKVPAAREVNTGGLATGGGALGSDRTITVLKSSAAEFRAGTVDTKALTPKDIWDAAAVVALTDATTIAVDMALGFNFSCTIAANRTLGNPTNPKVGQSGTIDIIQNGTGGFTLAFGSYWKFSDGAAPSIVTTANAVNALHYRVRTTTFIELSLAKDVK